MRHLTRLTAVTALAVLLLFALSSQLPAAPVDPLLAAFQATGAGRLDVVRYSGIGATFVAGQGAGDATGWTRAPFHRYDANVDLTTGVVQVRLTPVPAGDVVTASSRSDATREVEAPAGADAATGTQAGTVPRVWLTPHGFLKAARAHEARVASGPRETAIVFEHERHRVAGFLNDRYQVDRVQVWAVEDGGPVNAGGDTRTGASAPSREARIEVRYRDYEPMPGGGAFPRHIIETRHGQPMLDLWVWAASGVPARVRLTPGL